jgi:O-antigen ligase
MGFPLTLIYLVFTLLSPGDMIPEIAPLRPMLVLTLMGLLLSAVSLLQRPAMLRTWQSLFLFGLFAMICVSRAVNGWVGGALAAFSDFAVHVVTFLLILLSCNSIRKVRIVMVALSCVAIYYAARGVMAVDFGIETEKYATEDRTAFDPQTGELLPGFLRTRGLGYLNDPNDLCQLYLVSIAFLWTFFRPRQPLFNLAAIYLPTLFLLYGFYQTGSRGGLVGLFVLFAAMLYRRLGTWSLFLSGGASALLLLVLGFGGSRSLSVSSGTGGSRLELWSNALSVFRDNPIFGIGFEGILDYMEEYLTVHNSWLLALAELGVTGAFFWMALLTVSVLELRQLSAVKTTQWVQAQTVKVGQGMLAALLAWMGSAWFLSRTYTISLYMLLALIAVVWVQGQDEIPELKPARFPQISLYTLMMMVGSIVAVWVSVRLRWAG